MATNALQAVLDRAARQSEQAAPRDPSAPQGRKLAQKGAAKTKRAPLPERAMASPDATEEAPGKFHRPVRDGRRFIGGHFSPEVARQLRMIAAEDDTTIQELLETAIDLLFVKKGRTTIAALSK